MPSIDSSLSAKAVATEALANVSGARGSRWEWLTRRAALAEARARAANPLDTALLDRARAAVSAGATLLDPVDGGRPAPEVALSLFRDAAQCLLRAMLPGAADSTSLRDLRQSALRTPIGRASRTLVSDGPPAALSDVSYVFASVPAEVSIEKARAGQRWVVNALDELALLQTEVTRVRVQRWTRGLLVALVAVGLVGLGVIAVDRVLRGPNLAAGKPWRASSSFETCQPAQHWCGIRTDIFFHTLDDAAPWVEFDLSSAQQIGRVVVRNRSDYGPERAVPLVVELSSDGQNYWQVAQQIQPFDRWTARFSSQTARYVRLTVRRRTYFHLEGVSVYRW